MQAGGGSEAILLLNMQTIGIRNEQTVKAIVALARRKELGGPGGILWKILSSQYRPTLLKKNEPGDYILWALNHPTEFENTYNGTLKKLIRGRLKRKSLPINKEPFYFYCKRDGKPRIIVPL